MSVLAHETDEELPAWSLPASAGDSIHLPSLWPERVNREWAFGGSTGAGVRVCVIDSGIQEGHYLLEPAIAPLGFDWKMGIGIVASFAAREVFVSTMSTVYNIGKYEESESGIKSLAQTLQDQRRSDGSPVYTPLVAVSLMVFYVFALQCVSTVAVVRRETNSWKWPAFQWLYMGALAWVLAFITYQGGRWLGLG